MDDPALLEGRRVHAALNAFDKVDIFDLQHLVEIPDGLEFRLVRCRLDKEEIIGFERSLRPDGDDVQDDHRRTARIAHDACRRVQPPDSMGAHGRVRHVIGAVRSLAGIGHVAGIDAVGGHLVGVHIDQRAEILVCRRAVIAFEEIVDDILPVRPDVIGQPVPEGQFLDIRRPVHDLAPQVAGLLGERRGLRVEIDIDETAERLDLNLIKADFGFVEPFQRAGMRRHVKLAVKPVGPGVIRAGDMADTPLALQQFMRPVLADIVEGAKRIIAVTDDDDGASGDIRCDIGPRLAQLLDMAHPLPGMREHGVLFQAEPVCARIGLGLQRQGR